MSGDRMHRARVAPARIVAFEVLSAVRTSDAYANLLLPVRIERAGLDAADAGLATELTYGTLRMSGYYDAVIALASGRAPERIDGPVLDVLRLGAHQVLSMRTAQHAAVDQSVELVRQAGSASAAGFVNGVLRTLTRTAPEEWRARVLATTTDRDDRLALEYSHPAWVVRAFRHALAAEGHGAEVEALLAADNAAPRISLVRLPGLAAEDPTAEHTRYSPLGLVAPTGDPASLRDVRRGVVRVQDEGSQLAALALSRARPATPGERWLDLCAGPGGKAALLAAEAVAAGAEFTANELVPARAGLVRQALSVFDPHPEVLVGDGIRLANAQPGRYDRIMLDAPCTGLGALRRRPEARWRKSPRDVAELSALQSRLLAAAVTALKPGGLLAYVTCSPHLGETKVVVDDAVKRSGGALQTVDTPAVLASVTQHPLDLPDDSHVQLWPHRHGTDAMFIQLLTKVAE